MPMALRATAATQRYVDVCRAPGQLMPGRFRLRGRHSRLCRGIRAADMPQPHAAAAPRCRAPVTDLMRRYFAFAAPNICAAGDATAASEDYARFLIRFTPQRQRKICREALRRALRAMRAAPRRRRHARHAFSLCFTLSITILPRARYASFSVAAAATALSRHFDVAVLRDAAPPAAALRRAGAAASRACQAALSAIAPMRDAPAPLCDARRMRQPRCAAMPCCFCRRHADAALLRCASRTARRFFRLPRFIEYVA